VFGWCTPSSTLSSSDFQSPLVPTFSTSSTPHPERLQPITEWQSRLSTEHSSPTTLLNLSKDLSHSRTLLNRSFHKTLLPFKRVKSCATVIPNGSGGDKGESTLFLTLTRIELISISWASRRASIYWLILLVPAFSFFSSLSNMQPLRSRELPVMIFIAVVGYVANRAATMFVSLHFPFPVSLRSRLLT